MKNLKNNIRLLGLFIFLTGSQPVFAQGNIHTEKDKKEQTRQEQKEREIRDAYKQKIKNAKGQEKKELEEELEKEVQQFNEKAKKNKGGSDAKEDLKKAKKIKKGQPDSKENQGNAYGRNKGDLEGREFGQARAADARAKVDQYNNRLTERRQIVILGKRKIEGARIRLAAQKKNNTLTSEEIAEREARIVVFESRLNAFEAALVEAIRKNEAQKAQLVVFYDQD
jgi:colicin import membrane protein